MLAVTDSLSFEDRVVNSEHFSSNPFMLLVLENVTLIKIEAQRGFVWGLPQGKSKNALAFITVTFSERWS